MQPGARTQGGHSAPPLAEMVVEPGEPPPPFGGSWKRVYTGVFVSQVVFVVLLFVLSELAS